MSNVLALRHNLTCKAVRDIWNMRTWQKVTCKHWSLQDQHKVIGNPPHFINCSIKLWCIKFSIYRSRVRLSPCEGVISKLGVETHGLSLYFLSQQKITLDALPQKTGKLLCASCKKTGHGFGLLQTALCEACTKKTADVLQICRDAWWSRLWLLQLYTCCS